MIITYIVGAAADKQGTMVEAHLVVRSRHAMCSYQHSISTSL